MWVHVIMRRCPACYITHLGKIHQPQQNHIPDHHCQNIMLHNISHPDTTMFKSRRRYPSKIRRRFFFSCLLLSSAKSFHLDVDQRCSLTLLSDTMQFSLKPTSNQPLPYSNPPLHQKGLTATSMSNDKAS